MYFKVNKNRELVGVSLPVVKSMTQAEVDELLTTEESLVTIAPIIRGSSFLSITKPVRVEVKDYQGRNFTTRMDIDDYVKMTCSELWTNGFYSGKATLTKRGREVFIKIPGLEAVL